MITLAHLRSLSERALTHTENPAIVRLTDRTVEGVARAYMGRGVWITVQGGGYVGFERPIKYHYWHDRPYVDAMLDLTDPGTAHALLVALALALGLDPGVGGLGVRWGALGGAWSVNADRWVVFGPAETRSPDDRIETDPPDVALVEAPTVAAEPDPIKALALAALHVLEHP